LRDKDDPGELLVEDHESRSIKGGILSNLTLGLPETDSGGVSG
jgi:hypothetical protein